MLQLVVLLEVGCIMSCVFFVHYWCFLFCQGWDWCAGGPGDTDFKGGGVTTPALLSPVVCMAL